VPRGDTTRGALPHVPRGMRRYTAIIAVHVRESPAHELSINRGC